MTNYERIKNMSVEEWAKVIDSLPFCYHFCAYGKNGQCNGVTYLNVGNKCAEGIKKWLESESDTK